MVVRLLLRCYDLWAEALGGGDAVTRTTRGDAVGRRRGQEVTSEASVIVWNCACDHCCAGHPTPHAALRGLWRGGLGRVACDARWQPAAVLNCLLNALFKARVATETAHPYLQQHSSFRLGASSGSTTYGAAGRRARRLDAQLASGRPRDERAARKR